MEQKMQLETLRLCVLWIDLLDHAGEYAKRYYTARALECPYGQRYARACNLLAHSYKTRENLNAAIRHDLESFPDELLEILDAQMACGLPAFSKRRDYLNQVVMGLTMSDRRGKKRRDYYRRQINKIMNAHEKGKPATALSLNQLESGFIENQQKLAARRAAKKAA